MATITMEIRGASSGTIVMFDASKWVAAEIIGIRQETPVVKTFRFRLPRSVQHLPGQHYEIRLTAPDGYQAARLYSAASAARGDAELELTIALLPDGEVSPYMHQVAKVGDMVELRGPLGKFFVWEPEQNEPALLVAGGSGVAPMRCILQAHILAHSHAPLRLLYSARTAEDIIYKDEFAAFPNVDITLTRDAPPGWTGQTGRIDTARLTAALAQLPENALCYICGATPFVEAIADMLVALGVGPARIKTERFGAAK